MEPPANPPRPPSCNAPCEGLSWEQAPGRRLIRLALPITLSGLSFAVMGLVDTVFVAKLGPSVLAGVGLGVVITNGVMGFGFGVLRGLKTLLAQARGSGAADASQRYVGAGVLLGLWLGLGALVLGELAARLIPLFTESHDAGRAASEYIAVRSLGAPVIVVYVALREARYGLGDTRSALVSSVAGNLVHALLDYVFLFVLGWGAKGAALANVLAFSTQMAWLCAVQWREGLSFARAGLTSQRSVFRAGAFTGLHWALEIGVFALMALTWRALAISPWLRISSRCSSWCSRSCPPWPSRKLPRFSRRRRWGAAGWSSCTPSLARLARLPSLTRRRVQRCSSWVKSHSPRS